MKALNEKYDKAMNDLDDARIEKKDMEVKINQVLLCLYMYM